MENNSLKYYKIPSNNYTPLATQIIPSKPNKYLGLTTISLAIKKEDLTTNTDHTCANTFIEPWKKDNLVLDLLVLFVTQNTFNITESQSSES